MSNEKSSFEYLWELLNPPLEFHNMRTKCESKLWNACTIHMQHRIYRLIRNRKRAGKPVEPNPWYAIVNARSSFGAIASEVARRLREGDTRPRSIIWKEVASTFAAE